MHKTRLSLDAKGSEIRINRSGLDQVGKIEVTIHRKQSDGSESNDIECVNEHGE